MWFLEGMRPLCRRVDRARAAAEVIPCQARIAAVGDDADLPDIYATERHLLYAACTRARAHLLITGVDPATEFFDDLKSGVTPGRR